MASVDRLSAHRISLRHRLNHHLLNLQRNGSVVSGVDVSAWDMLRSVVSVDHHALNVKDRRKKNDTPSKRQT